MRLIFITLLSIGLLGCSSELSSWSQSGQYQNARATEPLKMPTNVNEKVDPLYPVPGSSETAPVQKVSMLPPTMEEVVSPEEKKEGWDLSSLFKNVKLGRDKASMPQPGARGEE